MRYEEMCLDPEAMQNCPFNELVELQRECYEKWALTMSTEGINNWAADMALRYGPKVIIGTSRPLTWQAALAVVRYGGSPFLVDGTQFWPDQFTKGDEDRAMKWYLGTDVPSGAIYLN